MRAAAALFVILVASRAGAEVRAVDAIGITVSDLDRSVAFYRDVLGFSPSPPVEAAGEAVERLVGVWNARVRSARLTLGEEAIVLTEFLAPRGGRPVPADTRSNDRWFQHVAIVVGDLDAAYARLRAHRVRHISNGPQTLPAWNPNAGGIRAFYFQDPDGHALELIWYPPGKGDPRWQRKPGLFLGIDHTAISVGDTEASLRLYRDRLGMRVSGASENWGPEQEHLNGVFGARLRITALRAVGGGPGVELLEYLAPRDGRPIPADLRPNDLAYEETRVRAGTAQTLRDPDGHAVVLTP
jgi:catechol 2,3-dioxygenase-like lactoylglutathione lyase family enzyme